MATKNEITRQQLIDNAHMAIENLVLHYLPDYIPYHQDTTMQVEVVPHGEGFQRLRFTMDVILQKDEAG